MKTPLDFSEQPPESMQRTAADLATSLHRRRTVRDFSDRPIPDGVVEDCIRAAGSAPSGANQQPWHFALVRDPDQKRQIRIAAEEEEREFYAHRAPDEWLKALAPFGTDASKPFLETAPCLIAVFLESWSTDPGGERRTHYYPKESVGIATGMLIAALHLSGLATLTHTPSPMGFLNEILKRPENEKPFLLLVVGFPAENALVPAISRKPIEEIRSIFEQSGAQGTQKP